MVENRHLKKNHKSPRGSITLISIHEKSHMNTYQGGRSQRRKKSLGYVFVILSQFLLLTYC